MPWSPSRIRLLLALVIADLLLLTGERELHHSLPMLLRALAP
ncbi:hypothetical protein [Streptomyces sp. NPDC050704]